MKNYISVAIRNSNKMIITNNSGKILKNDKTIEGEDLQIAGQTKTKKTPVIQIVTETRIRKYGAQKYENAPSREIKKWFELRKI